MRNEFNPGEWRNSPGFNQKKPARNGVNTKFTHTVNETFTPEGSETLKDVNVIIEKIEAGKIDLTSSYDDWLRIGFGFTHEFGEAGRSLFHRVSQFYPDYDFTRCDQQFDNCLKSNREGITIGTFFHLAKQAGIYAKDEENKPKIGSEIVPNEVYQNLPELLSRVCSVAESPEERDILLLGSLSAMSSCLPQWSGIYGGKRLYPNLYLFVSAPASAGKGVLNYCRRIVYPIHRDLRKQSQELRQLYEMELAEYQAHKKDTGAEKPTKPPEKLLFIPANSSSTGAFQLLNDNEGKGLIFETEGDTLAQAFKSEYGNYSDGFRKAFHHETISYYRRGDREYVDIESPRLSAVLSGTPKQVGNLIPDAENGLFSRFLFYQMSIRPEWIDVFKHDAQNGLEDHFDRVGNDFFQLYQMNKSLQDVRFLLTTEQMTSFNTTFQKLSDQYSDEKMIASVRRMGISAFRIAMILTSLRLLETGECSGQITCSDDDYTTSICIAETLLSHAAQILVELKGNPVKLQKNKKQKFLEMLPSEFSRKDYLAVADKLKIVKKTAEYYISKYIETGIIHREKNSHYIKSNEAA